MTAAPEDAATDRSRLVGVAYATPAPLAARAALYAYQREPVDIATWVLDQVEHHQPLSARNRVVDVGCGPGWYLAVLRERHPGITTLGLDLSAGMARATRNTGTPAGVADAMQLPIRTGSCDVAIATHMLYHVPDIALAASELARVVGPAGVVAIVTNGRGHLRELDALSGPAVEAVTGSPWDAPARSSARFLLEDAAALIAPALTVVATERARREIVLPAPGPVVAYVESEESLYGPALPTGTTWADVLREVETRLAAIIERDGAFVVHSDVGVLICRASMRSSGNELNKYDTCGEAHADATM
jgi:SAM-dependent methyltransferase